MSCSETDFVVELKNIYDKIDEINTLISGISRSEESLRQNKQLGTAEQLELSIERVKERYSESIRGVGRLINVADGLIQHYNARSGSNAEILPSADSFRNSVKNFLIEGIKMKSAPIPQTCGCYSYKNTLMKPGMAICALHGDEFILAFVHQMSKEGNSMVALTPIGMGDAVRTIELRKGEWTPLPTMIPDKPIARWEFSVNANVLSLFKQNMDDDYSWTMNFYKATVIKRPCDKIDSGERGYLLSFGNDIQQNVPEKYVTHLSDAWAALENDNVKLSTAKNRVFLV